jgi:hypothetical protein
MADDRLATPHRELLRHGLSGAQTFAGGDHDGGKGAGVGRHAPRRYRLACNAAIHYVLPKF